MVKFMAYRIKPSVEFSKAEGWTGDTPVAVGQSLDLEPIELSPTESRELAFHWLQNRLQEYWNLQQEAAQ